MEFGIEPHSLFQARGTTGNDHISATLPNARHRRAVFSVQCPARHSGVAPSADHPPPEATTTTTMANRRPARRSYSRLRDDFRRGGSRASNRLRPSGSSSCVWAGVINGCSKNAPQTVQFALLAVKSKADRVCMSLRGMPLCGFPLRSDGG